jgi:hypothetical protein
MPELTEVIDTGAPESTPTVATLASEITCPQAAPETSETSETSTPTDHPHRIHPKASSPSTTPTTHKDCKQDLDKISLGMEHNPITGGTRKKNARLVSVEMWERTKQHFLARGKFLHCGTDLYYLDEVDHLLVPIAPASSPLRRLLLELGYIPLKHDTNTIIASLIDLVAKMPSSATHRMAFHGDDAIYIRSDENKMLRCRADAIEEVMIGTDGVILLAPDLAPWPDLETLKPLMDALRPNLGRTCTEVRPDLPLTQFLTTRWAENDPSLSAIQSHQLFLTRILFMYAASRYSPWPIILLIGDQDTGKSTGCELLLTLLTDDPRTYLKSLPTKEDNLATVLSSSSVVFFDNVDGAGLDDPKNAGTSDTLCHLSTGADVSRRKLYTDGEMVTQKIQNHGFFTARYDPFNRSDVQRRTITLKMEPSDAATTIPKDKLRKAVQQARPEILAEVLLRVQNIVRAHQRAGDRTYKSRSEMVDYEVFSYIAAEFEGNMAETETLWNCTRARYLKSISEQNPLVYCLSIWLGKTNQAGSPINIKRPVSSTTLHGELKGLFFEQRTFNYQNPISFGKAITKNLPALRTIGFSEVVTRSGRAFSFDPSPTVIEASQQVYKDFMATVGPSDLTRMAYSYTSRRDFTPEDATDFPGPDIDGFGNSNPKTYKN